MHWRRGKGDVDIQSAASRVEEVSEEWRGEGGWTGDSRVGGIEGQWSKE